MKLPSRFREQLIYAVKTGKEVAIDLIVSGLDEQEQDENERYAFETLNTSMEEDNDEPTVDEALNGPRASEWLKAMYAE